MKNMTLLIKLVAFVLLAGPLDVAAQTESGRRQAEESGRAGSRFQFKPIDDKSLELWEGDRPVFVYNHGVISRPGVPANRNRSTYIHPLYGLDGEVLTDDFPKDHYHHRGLFWSWPHVQVGDKHYDLWMLQGIQHRFERWLGQKGAAEGAALSVQNGWYAGDKKVVDERVRILVSPATREGRMIDLEFVWTPIDQTLTLQGAEGKSYGGLTLRYAPRVETVITTPHGQGKDDLHISRLPWADLSARFEGREQPGGSAIFISPDHPDYPPEWLTRHYGVLCVGWPGVTAKTFNPGEKIQCRYRVWIHRGAPSAERVAEMYRAYESIGRTQKEGQ